MSPGNRKDPFPAYCFKVVLEGLPASFDKATAFFTSVSGLQYETEVSDYREGGENRRVHRLVGSTKWSNLVLKRGFCKGFDIVSWVHSWISHEGARPCVSGHIEQLDTRLEEVCRWSFTRAWPAKWELSQYDASKSELAIETLELAHDGLAFDGHPLPRDVVKCQIVSTEKPDDRIEAFYNPKEITIKKSVPWSKHQHAKGNSPMLEFTTGENRTLSVELLFDASLLTGPGGVSIRAEIGKLEDMTMAPEEGQAAPEDTHPPLVIFLWEPEMTPFKGVITSLTTKFTRFSKRGVPLRATCNIEIKEVESVQAKAMEGA